MQNRECIVFERTRDTEQRIYEPVSVCEFLLALLIMCAIPLSRHVDNSYFQSKDTCSFSEFTDWTAYVW